SDEGGADRAAERRVDRVVVADDGGAHHGPPGEGAGHAGHAARWRYGGHGRRRLLTAGLSIRDSDGPRRHLASGGRTATPAARSTGLQRRGTVPSGTSRSVRLLTLRFGQQDLSARHIASLHERRRPVEASRRLDAGLMRAGTRKTLQQR